MNKLKRFWKVLGPGLITGASDGNNSGYVTFSQFKAAFRLTTVRTALIAFSLLVAIR
jgi:Mn2+/Fe2+ NRAMP family transporter